MLDSYSLKARVYPVLIVLLPILMTGIVWSFAMESILHGATSLGLVGVLSYLLSQLGRDQGKRRENELWRNWGGPPTTQILRFSDGTIDEYTKQRYREKLSKLCPTRDQPDANLEKSNVSASDTIYSAWTKFLITKTRDTKNFSLLFKENTSYGFRRNLWALKPFGITVALILLILNYLYSAKLYATWLPFNDWEGFWLISLILILDLLFWVGIVNTGWVKIPANSYALRLCEAIDQL